MLVLGTQLHPDDKARVLHAYVYRMTTEAQRQYPEASAQQRAAGYRMPDRSDAEWLAATMFTVREDGRLDKRVRRCITNHYSKG